MILAGDIGGTNTRLAIFELGEGRLRDTVIEVFPSQEYERGARNCRISGG